jgi:phosphate:Na+ symporter
MNFSDEALLQMNEIFDVVICFAENIIAEFHEGGFPKTVDTKDENKIDMLRKKFKNSHVQRLHDGSCTVETGILFVDILNNLEKIGDKTFNIAQLISGQK